MDILKAERAEGPVTERRVNVLYGIERMTWIAVLGLVAAVGAAVFVAPDNKLAVIIAGISGAYAIGSNIFGAIKDLIALDADRPFDHQRAMHELSLRRVELEHEAVKEAERLAHEHRNAENEFRIKALEYARHPGPSAQSGDR